MTGVIAKPAAPRVSPNLRDYERTRAAFSWERAREALDGLPGGRGLNIAHEAVDRHATVLRGSRDRRGVRSSPKVRRARPGCDRGLHGATLGAAPVDEEPVIDAAPSSTTRTTLAWLASLHDDEGILSLYADSGAELGARHEPPSAEIALRTGLAALRERLEASGELRRLTLLERRLRQNAARLSALTDPSRRARGWALFIPLSGGAPHEAASTARAEEQVVLESTAYLMPLLPSLGESAPVGVVAVSGEGARAIEIRGAVAEECLRLAFDDQSAEWRRLQGPAGSTPANQRQVSSQVDLFARRVEEHRRHQLTVFGGTVWERARERGWSHVLVAGDPDRTEGLRASRPEGGPDLVVSAHLLPDHLSAVAVRDATAPEIHAARLAGRLALAEHVRDAALAAAGHCAVGVADTLGALAEGRVHHLLLDPTARPAGARAPDGRLVPAGEVPPGAAAEQMSPEPHLLERMLERALATDARVTAVDGLAAEVLAPFDGVACALRW